MLQWRHQPSGIVLWVWFAQYTLNAFVRMNVLCVVLDSSLGYRRFCAVFSKSLPLSWTDPKSGFLRYGPALQNTNYNYLICSRCGCPCSGPLLYCLLARYSPCSRLYWLSCIYLGFVVFPRVLMLLNRDRPNQSLSGGTRKTILRKL